MFKIEIIKLRMEIILLELFYKCLHKNLKFFT